MKRTSKKVVSASLVLLLAITSVVGGVTAQADPTEPSNGGVVDSPSSEGTGNPSENPGTEEGSSGTENGSNETQEVSFNVHTPAGEWVSKAEARVTVEITNPNAGIALNNYNIDVNGKEDVFRGAIDNDNPRIEVNLSTQDVPEDGVFNVKVNVVDANGKTSFTEFTLKVDDKNPVYTGGAIVNPKGNLHAGTYYSNQPVTLHLGAIDNESGVREVALVHNETSERVVLQKGTGEYPYQAQIGKDGSYQVEVIDLKGNLSTSPLSSKSGLPNVFKFSNKKPAVSIVVNNKNYDGTWVTTKPTLVKAIFTDDAGLAATVLKVNGVVVDRGINTGIFGNSELEVDLSGLSTPQNGIYEVVAEANNAFSNSQTVSTTVRADYSKPTATAIANTEGTEVHEGNLYSSQNLHITLGATDQGSGVKVIKVVKRGSSMVVAEKRVENSTETVGNLTFNIEESGAFDVIVEDNAGNSETYPLETLLNKPEFGNIVVDSTNPVVTVLNPIESGSGVKVGEKTWFAANPANFKLNANDENIKNVKVEANGVVLETINGENLENKVIELGDKVKPNSDGSVTVLVRVEDKAGNNVEKVFTYYVDVTKPEVESVNFYSPEGGVAPGKVKEDQKSREKAWVYFLKNSINLTIVTNDHKDGAASSGMKEVEFTIIQEDGATEVKKVEIKDNSATLPIPENFKGFVDIQVVDNVGHKSSIVNGDGVITETVDMNVNTAMVTINLPKPVGKDINGLDLYSSDVQAQLNIRDNRNGLEKITWGTNYTGVGNGEQVVDNSGNISEGSLVVESRDRNIATALGGNIVVSTDNNGVVFKVTAEDNAGYLTEAVKNFSIDKTKPAVTVTYDTTVESGFYNVNRTATITVVDKNFTPGKVEISGVAGQLGTWKSLEDGTSWVNTMVFSEDMDYNWSIKVIDLAGNESGVVESGKFTVDKTSPETSVIFDNNNVRNGKFYKNSRTATITVVDKNFNGAGNGATISGGNVTGWRTVGNSHQTTVPFTSDGEFSLKVRVVDQAGNAGTEFSSGDFVIDQTVPVLNISGVQNGVAYRKSLEGSVTFSDKYLDSRETNVTLVASNGGKQTIRGNISGEVGSFFIDNPSLSEESDDIYTLNAVVTDLAGNVSNQNVVYNVNRYGSKYTFLTDGYLGKYLQGVDKDLVIRETSVSALDLTAGRVVIEKDGDKVEIPGKSLKVTEGKNAKGRLTYDYTLDKGKFSEDGRYLVQVYSKTKDGVDNSSLSQEYAFVVDSVKPQVRITGIEDGKSYNTQSREVVVNIVDKSGVSSVSAKLNGHEIQLEERNEGYVVTLDSSEGLQNFEVVATDLAGNQGTSTVSDFRIGETVVGSFIGSVAGKLIGGTIVVIGLFSLILLVKRKRDKDREAKRREMLRHTLLKSGQLG